MINKEEDIKRRTVAFYKVDVKEEDGSTHHMIFKTAKADIEELFRAKILPDRSPKRESIISVELLWEGPTYCLIDPFRYLMSDIYKFGLIGRVFKDDLELISSVTEEYIEVIEFIADAIKEKADRVKVFLSCLAAWEGEVSEGKPLLADDIKAS